MGNFYTKQPRIGNYPYTRSGIAPPKLPTPDNQPQFRSTNKMSLEMHLIDERARTAGMSNAEREWRAKWIKDQHLHPDEPIIVDAVHRQLNPIRRIYRLPLDWLYMHYLKPTLGVYWGSVIRTSVPRFMMIYMAVLVGYYYFKYDRKDWQRRFGPEFRPLYTGLSYKSEIEDKYPGLIEQGTDNPAKYNYDDPAFVKRVVYRGDLGPSTRPW